MRQPEDRPNIILINCDDLGWGDLGCTGHPQHKTPHLDSLAADGTRFTDFYQASSLCSPSRGAMLTGCHPCRIGFDSFEGRGVLFPGQGVGLAPTEETFADMLRRAGYSTNIVGKWHCGDQPEFLPANHGFDTYYGLPYSNDMGIQRPDSPHPPLPLLRGTEVVEAQPDQRSLIFRYTEECTRIIRANRDRPFLLYLAHMHVHLPHYVAEKFLADSPNGRYGGAVAAIDWSTGVILNERRKRSSGIWRPSGSNSAMRRRRQRAMNAAPSAASTIPPRSPTSTRNTPITLRCTTSTKPDNPITSLR